jgi:CRP-like cAMP-binding protein
MSALAAPPSTAPVATPAPRGVALLRVDRELREAIPAEELPMAERLAVAPVLHAATGPWVPSALDSPARNPFAALLVSGMVTREVRLADRAMTSLLGPGDVFNPWPSTDGALPAAVQWRVDEPAVIALLDDRLRAAMRRWPQLGSQLHTRLTAQVDRMALHCALTALPRVEQRIIALFWHLADRWGRVSPDGVMLPLRLTHEAIGRLVGAQRPTVTLALRELSDQAALTRVDQSHWLLRSGPDDLVAPRVIAAA